MLTEEQLDEIVARVPQQVIDDIKFVQQQVRHMAERQLESLGEFEIETLPGVMLSQKQVPIEAAGAYIPGGKYPLLASAHMTIVTAKVAGVPRVAACTPLIKGEVPNAQSIRINRLVNNAGVNAPALALDVQESDWDTVFDTNIRGTFFLTQGLAKRWIANGQQAAIVNIASQAGVVAIEERAAYGTSKAALIHLTKVLALEWAELGIRVNAVAPTFVKTELTASTLSRPEWAQKLKARIPLGRFGEPQEIAGVVEFLLSDDAGLITGHTLAIDGGYTIR